MAKKARPTAPGPVKKKTEGSARKAEGEKIISENRKARFNYEILDTVEAGLVLRGTEVKSLRAGHVVIQDAYAIVRNGELFLLNMKIEPYAQGNVHNHEPTRMRKLLAHKREIERLAGKTKEKGLTIVVLKLYWKNGRAKALLGVGKGKREYDRRQVIKSREYDREAARVVRRGSR